MAKQATPLCPCYFQLPLLFNPEREGEPGQPVGEDMLEQIYALIERQFDGFTTYRDCEGSWHGLREPSMRVCVAVPEDQIDRLKAVVRQIGKALKQKAMFFERGLPNVELIEVEQ